MAYTPHTYVTIGGSLSEESGQDEIWQIGIRGFDTHGGGQVPFSTANLAQYATNLVDPAVGNIQGWFAGTTALCASTAILKFAKVANINASGHYSEAPQLRALNTPGGFGATVPSFLSAALSFTTDTPFGRLHRRGRVYPPNYAAASLAGTARISDSSVSTLVTGAIALLNAVTITDPNWQFTPYVVSRAGGFGKITGVRVGNVWDVQRRRKNAVPESYQSHAFP